MVNRDSSQVTLTTNYQPDQAVEVFNEAIDKLLRGILVPMWATFELFNLVLGICYLFKTLEPSVAKSSNIG